LNDESPVGKIKFNLKRKFKIGCLWTHLDFIEGLIEFTGA
jgi:hypothetical protein